MITSVIVAACVFVTVLFSVNVTNALFVEINKSTANNANAVLGSIFAIIILLPYWIIAALFLGIPALILSIILVKNTKWGIIHLVSSLITLAGPFAFIFIASNL